jgi:hypothetical protein
MRMNNASVMRHLEYIRCAKERVSAQRKDESQSGNDRINKGRRKNLVRQRGLEPPRYCYRQPLKLVRLPIPPLPHKDAKFILAAARAARNRIKKEGYFFGFCGAGACCCGAGVDEAGAVAGVFAGIVAGFVAAGFVVL